MYTYIYIYIKSFMATLAIWSRIITSKGLAPGFSFPNVLECSDVELLELNHPQNYQSSQILQRYAMTYKYVLWNHVKPVLSLSQHRFKKKWQQQFPKSRVKSCPSTIIPTCIIPISLVIAGYIHISFPNVWCHRTHYIILYHIISWKDGDVNKRWFVTQQFSVIVWLPDIGATPKNSTLRSRELWAERLRYSEISQDISDS